MILFKRVEDLSRWLQQQRSQGRSIGFVPTMGALHPGHISLIDISKKTTGITVCSIFVNPTQFNDPKDFQKYPITIEKDIYLLEKAGTDVLFLPEVDEIYPGGTKGLETYELGGLETLLEGKYRPGHFQGVCQVMRRLLEMVGPDDLFMGQKDYQQCMVVRRLIELMKADIRLHPCPIIREADGLAMSSRNLRLTAAERSIAPAIYQVLTLIRKGWEAREESGTDAGGQGGDEQMGDERVGRGQVTGGQTRVGSTVGQAERRNERTAGGPTGEGTSDRQGAGQLAGGGSARARMSEGLTEGQTGSGSTGSGTDGQTGDEQMGDERMGRGQVTGGQTRVGSTVGQAELRVERTAGGPTTKDGLEALLGRARAILEEKGFRIDYVEIADAATLKPIGDGVGARVAASAGQKVGVVTKGGVVALVAAFLGEIRLIDNMLLQ